MRKYSLLRGFVLAGVGSLAFGVSPLLTSTHAAVVRVVGYNGKELLRKNIKVHSATQSARELLRLALQNEKGAHFVEKDGMILSINDLKSGSNSDGDKAIGWRFEVIDHKGKSSFPNEGAYEVRIRDDQEIVFRYTEANLVNGEWKYQEAFSIID